MDLSVIKEWFTLENIMGLIEEYATFGPLAAILLPLLEAFLPFLPLFVFVMANANAFGLGLGFLYSWIGSVIGAFCVFYIFRKFGQKRFLAFLKNHKQVNQFVGWVDRKGFSLLFLLLCFPFTPSSVVNIVSGLSKVSFYQYGLAVMAGKMVMIFTISYIGHDIPSLFNHPERTAFLLIIIFVLWFAGKRVEAALKAKIEKEQNSEKVRIKKIRKSQGE